jgi:hypothetical protein
MKYAYSRQQTAVAWLIYKLETNNMLKNPNAGEFWNILKRQALRMESHEMLDTGSYFHSKTNKEYEVVSDFFKDFYEFYNARYYNEDNIGPDDSLFKITDILEDTK